VASIVQNQASRGVRGKNLRGSRVSVAFIVFLLLFLSAGALRPQETRQPSSPRKLRLFQQASIPGPSPKYSSSHILVRFRAGVSSERITALHTELRGSMIAALRLVSGLQVIQISEGLSVQDVARAYRFQPEVLYAEPDYTVHAYTDPNDPKYPLQWNLQPRFAESLERVPAHPSLVEPRARDHS
jgi:hypothetical protein